jgi:3-dehydroquinate synthase
MDEGSQMLDIIQYQTTRTFQSRIHFIDDGFVSFFNKNKSSQVWFYDPSLPSSILDIVHSLTTEDQRFAVPLKEEAKTLASFQSMIAFLDALDINQSTRIIAIGGGALLDAVGFISSVYRRGLSLCFIPTTLLAMVDASIGGKTALNTKYKNQIGTFYPAEDVVIDFSLLPTMPVSLIAEGMSEIIKIAFIKDRVLFDALKHKTLPIENIIAQAIQLKVNIVQEDLSDKNQRLLLNFGHTIGHAIEAYYQFTVPHGQCVAIGMLEELDDPIIKEALKQVLDIYQCLPNLEFNPTNIIPYLSKDKKIYDSMVYLVTCTTIGQGVVTPTLLATFIDKLTQRK